MVLRYVAVFRWLIAHPQVLEGQKPMWTARAGQLPGTRYAEGEAVAEGSGHHDETGEDMGTGISSARAREAWTALEARGWRHKLRADWWLKPIAEMNRTEAAYHFAEQWYGAARPVDTLTKALQGSNLTISQHVGEIERLKAKVERQRAAIEERVQQLRKQHQELEAAHAEVARLTSELDAMDRRRRTCRQGAGYLAELNGHLTEEVGRLKADIGAMRQRDDQRARDNRELLKRAEVAEAGVEALKAAPMYHVIGFDYGDPSISVVELVAKVEASDDDVKPATNGSDEEPQAFKVGEYVRSTEPVGFLACLELPDMPEGIYRVTRYYDMVERVSVRSAALGAQVWTVPSSCFTRWTPEPGDVVKLAPSKVDEWTVLEPPPDAVQAGKVLIGVSTTSKAWWAGSTAWVEPRLLTPLRAASQS